MSSATSCEEQVFEQPFLQWADPANYVLAPSGTFEQGSGSWDLEGAASVSTGDEPLDVHGAGEIKGLGLPAGSSATTGAMCVGIEHPNAPDRLAHGRQPVAADRRDADHREPPPLAAR